MEQKFVKNPTSRKTDQLRIYKVQQKSCNQYCTAEALLATNDKDGRSCRIHGQSAVQVSVRNQSLGACNYHRFLSRHFHRPVYF